MSTDAGSTRELIAFQGEVRCEAATGAVSLILQGHSQGAAAQVLFCALSGAAPAGALHDARVTQRSADAGAPCWRLTAGGTAIELHARTVQVHRDAAARFFAALPPPAVPRRVRWGWAALLTMLRLPGMARLLIKLRG